jgi:hypothetical protein
MSKRGRNDRHDTDPIEGKLIRIGHYQWKLYRQAARAEKDSLDAALETVWKAKREYRVELRARRKASAEAFVARLRKQTTPRAAQEWPTAHKVIAKQRRKRNTTR